MSTASHTPRFQVSDLTQIEPVACPCGLTRRAFCDDVDGVASIHLLDVQADARTHYHRRMTEIYYVLQGNGQLELDGNRFEVSPGHAVLIKPGCRHRAIGNMKVLVIPIPAFDPEDEWFD